MEVGKGKDIYKLKQGDIVKIQPNEEHYYHNVFDEECIVRATLCPANRNFENSLFILKGLSKDGLASAAGTPKKLSDLALFVYLNNSRMVEFQKIAEPIFNYVAKVAIKNGRLDELIKKYCNKNA